MSRLKVTLLKLLRPYAIAGNGNVFKIHTAQGRLVADSIQTFPIGANKWVLILIFRPKGLLGTRED